METKIDMSLEERIEYHKRLAEKYERWAEAKNRAYYKEFHERAEHHKQYAEWLTELRQRREADKVARAELDGMIGETKITNAYESNDGYYGYYHTSC